MLRNNVLSEFFVQKITRVHNKIWRGCRYEIIQERQICVKSIVYLSLNSDKEKMTLSKIAKENDISTKYLEQIFSNLKRSGIVKSVAGINGGYLLARPSTDISVEDVLNAVEGDYKIEDEEISENCMVKGISKALQRLVIDRINEETGKVIKNVTLRKLADEYSNTDRDADEMYYI